MSGYLLDTMAVLLMGFEPEKVGRKAAATIGKENARIFYSVASLWEIGIKMGNRGYREFVLPDNWEDLIPTGLAGQGITELPILPAHCRRIQDLPPFHKDPFDRILIAKALDSGLTVIGSDSQFDAYGVSRIW